MKRVSLIAAGLFAFGLTAARAEVGTKTESGSTANTMPPTTNVDVNVNPPPASDVDVNVNPPATKPPPAATPGTTVEVTPMTPADVDVNINPPPPPPPVAAPTYQQIMPPARTIDANTAAMYGGVTEPAVPVQPLPVPNRYEHGEVHDTGHTWVGRVGAGLLVGGGFEDFTNSNLRSMTGTGGVWNARVVAGTRSFVGVEAAYVGAARSVDALGVQSSAVLLANGVEGALRVQVPIVMRRAQLLEPFGFVGLGWSHYQVTNTNTNTSDLARDDDIMAVPVGGGLAYGIGRFMADARFTYRSTYYNDLMRTGGSLNNWGVGTQVGFSF